MARKLDDFTVRVNLDGWHIRGHGSCWEGQEFHGSEILPRMVTAIVKDEKFMFQGVKASVCVLRGGTVSELKAAFRAEGLNIDVASGPAIPIAGAPVKKKAPPKPKKAEPVEEKEEEVEEEEEEEVEDDEDEDEEEDDEDEEEDDEEESEDEDEDEDEDEAEEAEEAEEKPVTTTTKRSPRVRAKR